MGNVLQSVKETSTVNYTYYSNGQVKDITTDGTSVYFKYDEYARVDTTINTNSGIIRYDHNAFGELTSQIDAKGNTTNIQYDEIGRINAKETPEETVHYVYKNSGYGKGKMDTIRSTTGTKITYSYDSYGRNTAVTKSIQGHSFSTTFGYDDWNNNTLLTYPSGFSTTNDYANGYLNEIRKTGGSTLFVSQFRSLLGVTRISLRSIVILV